jgi:retinol dehydrogenase 12
MQLYIVRELVSLISASPKEPKVIVNISNPGFCRSNIMREATGAWKLFIDTLKVILARTTEVGGRTVVAGVERGKESHGQYLNDCQVDT